MKIDAEELDRWLVHNVAQPRTPAGEGRVEEIEQAWATCPSCGGTDQHEGENVSQMCEAFELAWVTKTPTSVKEQLAHLEARLRAVEEESRTFEARWMAAVNESNAAQAEARRLREAMVAELTGRGYPGVVGLIEKRAALQAGENG